MTVLWPPNPKELERVGPGSHGRGSRAAASDGLVEAYGGGYGRG